MRVVQVVLACAVVMVGLAGCAITPARGTSVFAARDAGSGNEYLHRQVLFDHKCPANRVRYIRADEDLNASTVDLDVCGAVRRYKGSIVPSRIPDQPASSIPMAWTDVTSQYPAESLPAPLEPPVKAPASP